MFYSLAKALTLFREGENKICEGVFLFRLRIILFCLRVFFKASWRSPSCLFHLLHIAKSLVVSVQSQEFIVLATFHNLSFVKYTDFIGVADSRQAVSDGNRCTISHQPIEGVLKSKLQHPERIGKYGTRR